MIPRSLGNQHQWAIITSVEEYECILIALVEGAALMDDMGKSIALFHKNAVVTKRGNDYTYDRDDMVSSTKSTL